MIDYERHTSELRPGPIVWVPAPAPRTRPALLPLLCFLGGLIIGLLLH